MNFFEQELRKLVSVCDGVSNPVFAGRACYGDLGGDNRVKLQFVTMGYADNYEALKATILNRTDGEVDVNTFRFADIWGKKKVSNPNYSDGFIPHIYSNGLKVDWPVYKPTDADFKQLADSVSAYVNVFADRSAVIEKAPQNKVKKPLASRIEAGKAKAAEHNAAAR